MVQRSCDMIFSSLSAQGCTASASLISIDIYTADHFIVCSGHEASGEGSNEAHAFCDHVQRDPRLNAKVGA